MRKTTNIKRIRSQADEIFKTIISFNTSFMKAILTTKINSMIKANVFIVKAYNTITYHKA